MYAHGKNLRQVRRPRRPLEELESHRHPGFHRQAPLPDRLSLPRHLPRRTRRQRHHPRPGQRPRHGLERPLRTRGGILHPQLRHTEDLRPRLGRGRVLLPASRRGERLAPGHGGHHGLLAGLRRVGALLQRRLRRLADQQGSRHRHGRLRERRPGQHELYRPRYRRGHHRASRGTGRFLHPPPLLHRRRRRGGLPPFRPRNADRRPHGLAGEIGQPPSIY